MDLMKVRIPTTDHMEKDILPSGKNAGVLDANNNEFSPASPPTETPDETVFIAASPSMREVRSQVWQVADFDIPVLLLGESGTGKGVVARLIHNLSRRSRRTFLQVNCAALPSELLESELFGHEAGAFTGATRAKPGKFQVCDRGTILLDEVGEIPISLQAKLLHVLQDGQFSRLGSTSSTRVDVRVIAATNRNIKEDIAAGKFREDLYYRLNAYTIQLPPLRERREDIADLMVYFMAAWAAKFRRPMLPFSTMLCDVCMKYTWPGNIRELENFVKRYLIIGDEAKALKQLESLVHGDGNGNGHAAAAPAGLQPTTDLKSQVRSLRRAAEREAIARALGLANGSRKRAAGILNISVRALQYKIRECGIDPQNPNASLDFEKSN